MEQDVGCITKATIETFQCWVIGVGTAGSELAVVDRYRPQGGDGDSFGSQNELQFGIDSCWIAAGGLRRSLFSGQDL